MVARRQVERAAPAGGEVDVPHLLEIAAEVAALALQEQVRAVAGKNLRDLSRAQVHDAARPMPPQDARGAAQRQHDGGAARHDQCGGDEVEQPRHRTHRAPPTPTIRLPPGGPRLRRMRSTSRVAMLVDGDHRALAADGPFQEA